MDAQHEQQPTAAAADTTTVPGPAAGPVTGTVISPDANPAPGATVVDLDAARAGRTPDARPDALPDAGAEQAPVWGTPPTSGVVSGQVVRAEVQDVTTPTPDPASAEHDAAPADGGAGVPLEGVIVSGPGSGDGVLGPPELKRWRWTVGWRNKARRVWTYRYRYAWNTFVVLSTWLVQACGWWFRGSWRAVGDFLAYADDRQALEIASQTAGGVDGRANVDAWLKVRAERHREVRDRRRVVRTRLALPLVLTLTVVLLLVWLGQTDAVRAWIGEAALLGWVAAGGWLVWYGRPRTAPFWPQFREPSPYPPVTHDTVTGALLATGIGQFKELVKAGHSPVDVIYRDDGAGGKVAETHPVPGVTTEMIMSKAVVIAGALKRPPAMVHPAQAPTGVPGHVEILVLDIDPGKTKPKRFAYLGKSVNVGQPCTIGHDPRNRPVRWILPGANGVTTGTPGSGKTAYLINLACLAANDVDGAQVGIIDFKGMGDYSDLEPVCYAYAAEPNPADTCRLAVRILLDLQREVIRRRKILTDLKKAGSDLLDNNAAALTDRLARHRKYRMPWLLLILDEIHEGLNDPDHGKAIAALLIELMKIGRACGLHIEIASQRTDADSIPTSISSLPIIRVAFHQNGQPGNDQILGTGAYKRGIDATAFRRAAPGSAADDRGSCWYIGSEGGEPVKVRTTFVLPDVKRIVARARDAREKAGTLTGAAAGITEQPETAPAHSALDDVRAVFIGDEDALHGDVIFHRIDKRHPGRWKSQTALVAALKAEAPDWKSPTQDVGRIRPADAPDDPGIERTRRGIRLEHLQAAIDRRNTRRDTERAKDRIASHVLTHSDG
jgi:S-DNA-T family DNA segregation ATPase FtsK/SpoIIIE